MLSRHSSRADLSECLIHFTKGVGEKDAFEVMIQILREKRLVGSTGFVKGGTACISFTEAPLEILAARLNHAGETKRYSPFGLRFAKTQIFKLGGRPVIYQSDFEYSLLPPQLRWRHVRFELQSDPPIDWTWEREWRIACREMRFNEKEVEVVVPDKEAAIRFRERIERDSLQEAYAWTLVLGDLAWGYHQPALWRTLEARRAGKTEG